MHFCHLSISACLSKKNVGGNSLSLLFVIPRKSKQKKRRERKKAYAQQLCAVARCQNRPIFIGAKPNRIKSNRGKKVATLTMSVHTFESQMNNNPSSIFCSLTPLLSLTHTHTQTLFVTLLDLSLTLPYFPLVSPSFGSVRFPHQSPSLFLPFACSLSRSGSLSSSALFMSNV